MTTPPKAAATYVSSPSSASVKLSGRIVKKYQRIRARSSPLNDNVRRRLLDKLGQSSKAVMAEMNDQGLGGSKLSILAVGVHQVGAVLCCMT